MFKLFEIRQKDTHKVDYVGAFRADQKPDEVFNASPDCKGFIGVRGLYINVNEGSYPTREDAIASAKTLRMQYKLQIHWPDDETKTPAPKSKSTNKKPKDDNPPKVESMIGY